MQQGAAQLLVPSLPSQAPGSRCHVLQRESRRALLSTPCRCSLPPQWNLTPWDLAALEGNLPVFIALAAVELPSRFLGSSPGHHAQQLFPGNQNRLESMNKTWTTHSRKEKLLSQAKTTRRAIDSSGHAPKQLASLKGNFLMGCRSRNVSGTQTHPAGESLAWAAGLGHPHSSASTAGQKAAAQAGS